MEPLTRDQVSALRKADMVTILKNGADDMEIMAQRNVYVRDIKADVDHKTMIPVECELTLRTVERKVAPAPAQVYISMIGARWHDGWQTMARFIKPGDRLVVFVESSFFDVDWRQVRYGVRVVRKDGSIHTFLIDADVENAGENRTFQW